MVDEVVFVVHRMAMHEQLSVIGKLDDQRLPGARTP